MTFNELIAELNNTLSAFATEAGKDVRSDNIIGITDFSKATGYYVDSPTIPYTGDTILLNKAQSVKGGIVAIWYKGNVLDKTKFTNGTIVIFSGVNVLNELCLVMVMYDKLSNGFSVNIQTGFTGDLPTPDIAPAQMLITSITVPGDFTIPATMTITTIT